MNTSVDFAHAQCFNFTLKKNSLSTCCLQNGTTNAASEKATFFFPPINDDVILNSVNKFSSSHTIMKVGFFFNLLYNYYHNESYVLDNYNNFFDDK